MNPLTKSLDLSARVLLVVVVVLLGTALAAAYSLLSGPRYTSTAVVVVNPEDKTSTGSRDVSYAQVYGRIVTQPEILGDAADAIGTTQEQLRPLIQSSSSTSSPAIQISGTSPDPRLAAAYANAVARALIAYGNVHVADTGVQLALLGPAFPASDPSTSLLLRIAVGAASGLLVGLLVDFGRRKAGRRERTEPRLALGGANGYAMNVAASTEGTRWTDNVESRS